MTACNQPTVLMGTGWGVGLDSGDDAPQGRECDLSSNTMKASRAQQGFAPRLESPISLVGPATVRDTTTRSRIRVPWQRRSYIEATIFVMTYMNPWPDRWRGSNDLGRAAAASVRPAKLCDRIKISRVTTGPLLTRLQNSCFWRRSTVFSSIVTKLVSIGGEFSQ